MKWLKKMLGVDQLEDKLKAATDALEQARMDAEQAAREAELARLDPKALATAAGEPYISVVNLEIDDANATYGSVELDWNEAFIKKLRGLGYPGATDEAVVDLWFQDVCRNILLETYEQEVANREPVAPNNVRYINRKTTPDGKTEVS